MIKAKRLKHQQENTDKYEYKQAQLQSGGSIFKNKGIWILEPIHFNYKYNVLSLCIEYKEHVADFYIFVARIHV